MLELGQDRGVGKPWDPLSGGEDTPGAAELSVNEKLVLCNDPRERRSTPKATRSTPPWIGRSSTEIFVSDLLAFSLVAATYQACQPVCEWASTSKLARAVPR